MIHSNSSAHKKLHAAASTIPKDKMSSFVILNDRHSTTRTCGGKRWHQAKVDEKKESMNRTSAEKVVRAKAIFHNKGNEKPYFVRKLNDDEFLQVLEKSSETTLYKLPNPKFEYVYVKATEVEIENNVKSFRPSRVKKTKLVQNQPKTYASMNHSPSDLDPTIQFSFTADQLVQVLVRKFKLTVDDARKFITSQELKRYRSSSTATNSTNMATECTKKRKHDDDVTTEYEYCNQSSILSPIHSSGPGPRPRPMKRLCTDETTLKDNRGVKEEDDDGSDPSACAFSIDIQNLDSFSLDLECGSTFICSPRIDSSTGDHDSFPSSGSLSPLDQNLRQTEQE